MGTKSCHTCQKMRKDTQHAFELNSQYHMLMMESTVTHKTNVNIPALLPTAPVVAVVVVARVVPFSPCGVTGAIVVTEGSAVAASVFKLVPAQVANAVNASAW